MQFKETSHFVCTMDNESSPKEINTAAPSTIHEAAHAAPVQPDASRQSCQSNLDRVLTHVQSAHPEHYHHFIVAFSAAASNLLQGREGFFDMLLPAPAPCVVENKFAFKKHSKYLLPVDAKIQVLRQEDLIVTDQLVCSGVLYKVGAIVRYRGRDGAILCIKIHVRTAKVEFCIATARGTKPDFHAVVRDFSLNQQTTPDAAAHSLLDIVDEVTEADLKAHLHDLENRKTRVEHGHPHLSPPQASEPASAPAMTSTQTLTMPIESTAPLSTRLRSRSHSRSTSRSGSSSHSPERHRHSHHSHNHQRRGSQHRSRRRPRSPARSSRSPSRRSRSRSRSSYRSHQYSDRHMHGHTS